MVKEELMNYKYKPEAKRTCKDFNDEYDKYILNSFINLY